MRRGRRRLQPSPPPSPSTRSANASTSPVTGFELSCWLTVVHLPTDAPIGRRVGAGPAFAGDTGRCRAVLSFYAARNGPATIRRAATAASAGSRQAAQDEPDGCRTGRRRDRGCGGASLCHTWHRCHHDGPDRRGGRSRGVVDLLLLRQQARGARTHRRRRQPCAVANRGRRAARLPRRNSPAPCVHPTRRRRPLRLPLRLQRDPPSRP